MRSALKGGLPPQPCMRAFDWVLRMRAFDEGLQLGLLMKATSSALIAAEVDEGKQYLLYNTWNIRATLGHMHPQRITPPVWKKEFGKEFIEFGKKYKIINLNRFLKISSSASVLFPAEDFCYALLSWCFHQRFAANSYIRKVPQVHYLNKGVGCLLITY